MTNKIFVYHRAINSESNYDEFLQTSKSINHAIAAEGDLCWTTINNKSLIYIYHPDLSGKSISKEKLSELYNSNNLLTIEKIFSMDSKKNFILELKDGDDDIESFLTELKLIIAKYSVKNILVDAFSVEYLKKVKDIIPEVKTSLHTKMISGKNVLETTYQFPYIKFHNLYDLNFIDYITISYSTTHVNLFDLNIDSTYRHVYQSNKKLNLGSIKNIEAFDKAMKSKVEYIYLRSKEVKKYVFEKFIN